MRIRAIAAGALALAGPAAAQKDALAQMGIKVVEPMPAAQVAATKTRVRAELDRARASAWFEDVTDAYGGKARHRPSGLVCALGGKGQRIVAASADTATCASGDDATQYRIAVVRAPDGTTLADAVAAARAAVEREPGFAPSRGPAIVAHPRPGSDVPDHETLRFSSTVDGRERLSRLQVGVIRGWILTERRLVSGRKEDPMGMSELLEEATFGSNMKP